MNILHLDQLSAKFNKILGIQPKMMVARNFVCGSEY